MNNRYLVKLARSETKPHQQRILDKLDKGSMIAAHSMGSGKTLTALLAAEKAHKDFPDEHVTAIVPASLVSNMNDQIKEHGVVIDPNRFHVTTYDKAVNDIKNISSRKHSLIIVDEAHRLRNKDTKRSSELDKVLKTSRKNLLLTGTPSYNKPEDIAVLVNKAAGGKILPDNAKDFEDKFIGRRKVQPGFLAKHVLGVKPGEVTYLKNQGELKDALSQYVDTYDAQNTNAADFPTVSHHTVKVDMDKDQQRIYKFLEDDVPAPVRWKIRLGLPLSKKESSDLNAFSTGIRQASNNIKPYVPNPDHFGASPKQKKMADSIQERIGSDKNYRGISYSNYLESGLKPLSKELSDRGIANSIYDGSLSAREKDALVEDYNSGKVKQLLVSSSGAEGLNTKGTKLVQIMEPHFNKSKIDQVVARGVRYHSHSHLPDNERHVDVEHYHSTMPAGVIDKVLGRKTSTIDEYLSNASEQKDKVKNDIMNLVKQSAYEATTKEDIARDAVSGTLQGMGFEALNRKMKWMPHTHFGTAAAIGIGSNVVVESGLRHVENKYLNKVAESDHSTAKGVIGGLAAGGAVGGLTNHFITQEINDLETQNLRHALEAHRMHNWRGARSPETLFKDQIYEKAMWNKADIYERASDRLRSVHKPAVVGAALAAGAVGATFGSGFGRENKYINKIAEQQANNASDYVANRVTSPVAIISKLDQIGTPATKASTIALGMYLAATKKDS